MIYSIKEVGDEVYIAFPYMGRDSIPLAVEEWAEGTIDGHQWVRTDVEGWRRGIVLSHADAVVFKLKFG